MRVVLGTNVWVSALEFGGKPRLALDHALTVDQLAVSDFIVAEVLRVLTIKFGRNLRAVQMLLEELLHFAHRLQVVVAVSGVCRNPNYDAILETAVVANAELVVAGDKDLLILESYRAIAILTPAA